VGPHFPSPILETVQMQATEDRRGVLHASCSRFPGEGYPLLCQSERFRFLLMPIEQPGEIRDGRSAPQPADRPETVTQQEPNQEMPRKDEALSA
jgi:hypothetical protein